MTDLQLFAVTATGPQPLPVPAAAKEFTDLYPGLALGVYSIARTFNHNQFLHLEHHLARTVNSMRLLGWDYALDETRLRQAIHTLCMAFPAAEMRVRIDVLAEPALALGTASRELIALAPFTPPPADFYAQGVAVEIAADLARDNPLIKTAKFAAARKDQRLGANKYEALLVAANGDILEGASSNFYGIQAGVLYTAGQGVLEGITRAIVLDLARQLPLPVHTNPVNVATIDQLDEAAISSSSRGVLPVVQIGDTLIGNGQPGPYTRRLIEGYARYVAHHIKTAI